MIDYFRRLIKVFFYFAFFFVLLLGIIPALLEGRSIVTSFRELLTEGRFLMVAVLLLAYILVYPLINFVKIKRHLNGSFSENRPYFEEAFRAHGYDLADESAQKIVYRKKSRLTRAMYFWEDQVILDTTENPVVISGMRKTVSRLNRSIEHAMFKDKSL